METFRCTGLRGSFWGVSSGSVSWVSSGISFARTPWMGIASCAKQRQRGAAIAAAELIADQTAHHAATYGTDA